MENIYHYKITAISEETQTETVTNAGQGLNVLTIWSKNDDDHTLKQLDIWHHSRSSREVSVWLLIHPHF